MALSLAPIRRAIFLSHSFSKTTSGGWSFWCEKGKQGIKMFRTRFITTPARIYVSFCIRTITMTFPSGFMWEARIEGFVNIMDRQLTRLERREERRNLDDLWGDTPEARELAENYGYLYEDIFDLRRLFGLEPYLEVEVEEPW